MSKEMYKANQAIGRAIIRIAHEAYLERIDKMLSTPFDVVIDNIKNRKFLKNKGNGYFITESIEYLDELLEKEDVKTWVEVDTCNEDWFKAVEQFRW